jgi:hypothetical protein
MADKEAKTRIKINRIRLMRFWRVEEEVEITIN